MWVLISPACTQKSVKWDWTLVAWCSDYKRILTNANWMCRQSLLNKCIAVNNKLCNLLRGYTKIYYWMHLNYMLMNLHGAQSSVETTFIKLFYCNLSDIMNWVSSHRCIVTFPPVIPPLSPGRRLYSPPPWWCGWSPRWGGSGLPASLPSLCPLTESSEPARPASVPRSRHRPSRGGGCVSPVWSRTELLDANRLAPLTELC